MGSSNPPANAVQEEVAERQAILKGARQAVNSHGHAFQFAVFEAAKSAVQRSRAPWQFVASEFPIQVGTASTCIDLLFRHQHHPTMMVVEAKRMHPEFSRWLFYQAAVTARHQDVNELLFDAVSRDGQVVRVCAHRFSISNFPVYHFSSALKRKKSELAEWESPSSASDRNAPSDAAAQVLLGSAGIIEHFLSWQDEGFEGPTQILPVVVTTAELWGCRQSLSETELASGNVEICESSIAKEKWLALNVPRSVGRLPNSEFYEDKAAIELLLRRVFLRSVFVVNASHFEEFMKWTTETSLFLSDVEQV